jgi:TrmH family RNA methyltransferase
VAPALALSQSRTRLLARLRSRKSRARERRVLVEGTRAVGEALNAGALPVFAVTSPRLRESDAGKVLGARLESLDRVEVSDVELSSLGDTEHPQGVLLVCEEPDAGDGDVHAGGLFLLLDAVQDPGNVGSLVRCAVAFGFDAVLCLDGTGDPWSAKAVRASAGMAFRLPVVTTSAATATERLRSLGVRILVAAAEGGGVEGALVTAHEAGSESGGRGLALAVGNEGSGVRAEVRDAARGVVGVPMIGPAESLNASIAGAILMYDIARISGGRR